MKKKNYAEIIKGATSLNLALKKCMNFCSFSTGLEPGTSPEIWGCVVREKSRVLAF